MYTKIALKILPYVLGALLLYFVGSMVYDFIYDRGANSVQVKWDEDTEKRNLEIARLKQDFADREEDHRSENRRISSDLSKANLAHANAVAAVEREYDQRLRNAEQRASIYQRQAQGGAVERGDLASHASRLDAALEEGRALEQEYRATLGLRDQQLRAVSDQLLNDRALIEGKSP